MNLRSFSRGLSLCLFSLSLSAPPAQADYKLPPKELVDLVDAPSFPTIKLSPNNRFLLFLEKSGLKTIADLNQRELKLAGIAIAPNTRGESRLSYYRGIRLQSFPKGQSRPLRGLPKAARDLRIAHFSWSPDGNRFAFTLTGNHGIELWLGNPEGGTAKRLGHFLLNGALGMPYSWLPDGKGLLCRAIVPEKVPQPVDSAPKGPVIQECLGEKTPNRTYPDLLKSPEDEAKLEFYLKAQLTKVSLDGRSVPVGRPGLILGAEPSPDGRYYLVQSSHRPFSYTVPLGRFPKRIEVWDQFGKLVFLLRDLPLAEKIPLDFDAVRTGPRAVEWRADAPATLFWAEAVDRGDPEVKADDRNAGNARDALFLLSAPFDGKPVPWLTLRTRFQGIEWGNDKIAVLSEHWNKTRKVKTWLAEPGKPSKRLLFDLSSEDRYGDPGEFLTRPDGRGNFRLLISEDEKSLFLDGEGASPEGNRPFLDRFSLEEGKISRLWRSRAPFYDSLVRLLDREGKKLLISREAPEIPPNLHQLDLSSEKIEKITKITDLPDPTPGIRGIKKELISYRRADGVKLSGILYLPAGYTPEQGTLPMLMWAYPMDFKSADAAGQLDDSPYRFERIGLSSPMLWATQGYAVLDDPKIPIIGEGKQEPNDSYLEQLVAGAKAAVDEVVRRGVADPSKIAIGGHSYGAFMTANLLAHSDLFCAGIARSGAYNRTLTPFGFQSEERTFWQAQDTYSRMSPFNCADKIKTPLLLIHGQSDSNPGTFTLQSERLFQALKGLGGKARLVLLPLEEHSYRARESIMQVLFETNDWLDRFLKKEKETNSTTQSNLSRDKMSTRKE